MILAVPLTMFAELPDHVRCSGSQLAVGASITVGDVPGPRVRSIAELRNAAGRLVGWIYLANNGAEDAEFAQANGTMNAASLKLLHLKRDDGDASNVVPLDAPFVARDLRVMPCSQVEQRITD